MAARKLALLRWPHYDFGAGATLIGALSAVSGIATGLTTIGAAFDLSLELALLGPACAEDQFLNDM